MSTRKVGITVSLTLAAGLLCAVPGFAQSPDQSPSNETFGIESPQDQPQEFRAKLLDILDKQQEILGRMNNSQMQSRIARVAGRVRGLTDEQLARMAANGADLRHLQAAVKDLQRVVAEGTAGVQARSGFAASLSPAFPDASYSLLCGSTRTITEIIFAAQVALQVATVTTP